jgi:hypothetical protein
MSLTRKYVCRADVKLNAALSFESDTLQSRKEARRSAAESAKQQIDGSHVPAAAVLVIVRAQERWLLRVPLSVTLYSASKLLPPLGHT